MNRINHYLRFQLLIPTILTVIPTVSTKAEESASGTDFKQYIPNVHAVIRPRFEASFDDGAEYRFEVRNARLMLDGNLGKYFQYYFNTDFCDQGKIKILDVWAQANTGIGLSIRVGQFRQPFGRDSFRAPANYIFANRSFIGKQMCNVRAVGVKLTYPIPGVPVTLEGGIFNPKAIGDHTPWNSRFAYAARAIFKYSKIGMEAGFQSIYPDGIRTNLADYAITYTSGPLQLEAEYMYKHYTHKAHKACHGYNFWGNYRLPLRKTIFSAISFQGRFDGMTAHSSATRDAHGYLITDHDARNRITVGSTLHYIFREKMFVDIRLDYEKYFYHKGYEPARGDCDKLVAELVLHF